MPFSYNPLLGVGLDKSIPLDGAGKIPSTYLPSYVDDVEEYNNLAAFPATGETGKIYVAIDTGFAYRWSGSVYVQIGITAAAGATTQVQFNDAGAFGGDSGLTFNKTTDALSAGGFIPTSSTVPANGVYLPAANSVGVATNGAQRITIDTSGRLLVGTSSARLNVSLELEGTSFAGSSACFTRNSADNAPPALNFFKTRSSSNGGTTIVQPGDLLGSIVFRGADGSSTPTAAQISAVVEGTPAGGTIASRLVFSTTASGAADPTEAMRIRNDGQVLIGGSSNTKSGKLEVTGRLAVLNGIETIQTGSATYTAATTATEVIEFDSSVGGFFGAELFVTLRDISSPAGTIVQKVYVAARGSGTNVTAVSVSQSDILRQTGESGTFTGYLTWTAAVVSNRARLSVTATQTSGAATLTVHCNGSPFTFLI
jgi:hypothetical protein